MGSMTICSRPMPSWSTIISPATSRFVGVWDTVASVIVPRADRFYWPSLEELACTLLNPSVQTFRQAISMDERRCMFRLKKWDDPQTYKHNRFNDAHAEPQDIL